VHETASIALSDVLTIVSVLVAIGLQTLGFYRWIVAQLEQRDKAIAETVGARAAAVDGVFKRINADRDAAASDTRRIDSALADIKVAIARGITRNDLDRVIGDRLAPLERDLRHVVSALADRGLVAGSIKHGIGGVDNA
jgi:hypothetical protein